MRSGENGTDVWAEDSLGFYTQSVDVPKVPDPELDIVSAMGPAHTPFSETCLVLWSHS